MYVQTVRKTQLLLAGIVVAALAPFLNKAFHIDDPLFLWMAQQIVRHPFDPYGFQVNWASFPEPFWAQMQNPPLCSYFIAAVASLTGWSEPALHLVFIAWAILSILGTFALARRFCRQPFLAALMALFTPVFLVSATNLMCDVMLLALWVWSIELWIVGLERERVWPLIASAILVAAALLTKYFGIALAPLLAAYTLARDWRKWPRLFVLLIPLVASVAYELWTRSLYGRGLLTAATIFAHSATTTLGQSAPTQLLVGLTFAGGCALTPLLVVCRCAKFVFVAIGAIAVSILLFSLLVPINPLWALGANLVPVRVEGGIFAAIGAATIALAFVDLLRNRNAESLLLCLWTLGTFVFATFFNWSITARTILPMIPPVTILVVRFLDGVDLSAKSRVAQYVGILGLALVSLGVAAADCRQANTARGAAREFGQRYLGGPGTLWFESHWGFQYYMEKFGATPVNARDQQFASGDVIVIPANGVFTISIAPDRVFTPEEVNFSVLPFLTTAGRGTGACFYSSIRGPLPWAIDRVPPEMYYVARFR